MNYPYTLIITTSADKIPKTAKKIPKQKIDKIFKFPKSANFDTVKKAGEFATAFLNGFAEKRVFEPKPHRVLPIVIFSSHYTDFAIGVCNQKPTDHKPQDDTYKFHAITQLGLIVADTEYKPPSMWHSFADCVYIFPCGYEPLFLRSGKFAPLIETIDEPTFLNLLKQVQIAQNNNYLGIIKKQNTDGNEFADAE